MAAKELSFAPSKGLSLLMGVIAGLTEEQKKKEAQEMQQQKMFAEMMKLRLEQETKLGVAGVTAKGGIEQARISALGGIAGREVTAAGSFQEVLQQIMGREKTTGMQVAGREDVAKLQERGAAARTVMGISGRKQEIAMQIAGDTAIKKMELENAETISRLDRASREKITGKLATWRDKYLEYQNAWTADRIQAQKDMLLDKQGFEERMNQWELENYPKLSPEAKIIADLYSDSSSTLIGLAFASAQAADRTTQNLLAQYTQALTPINAISAGLLFDELGIEAPTLDIELEKLGWLKGGGLLRKRIVPVPKARGVTPVPAPAPSPAEEAFGVKRTFPAAEEVALSPNGETILANTAKVDKTAVLKRLEVQKSAIIAAIGEEEYAEIVRRTKARK